METQNQKQQWPKTEILMDTGSKRLIRKEYEDGAILLMDCKYPLAGYGNRYCDTIEYIPEDNEVVLALVTDGWATGGCGMTDYCVSGKLPLDVVDEDEAKEVLERLKSVKTFKDFRALYNYVDELISTLEEEEEVEEEEEATDE